MNTNMSKLEMTCRYGKEEKDKQDLPIIRLDCQNNLSAHAKVLLVYRGHEYLAKSETINYWIVIWAQVAGYLVRSAVQIALKYETGSY